MTDLQIKTLAIKYRAAIEIACNKGLFLRDIGFDDFPTGSCGDASYLLAEYLRREGVETIWYSAERRKWSHSWLVVRDRRVKNPTPRTFSWPEELRSVVSRYGVQQPEEEVDITRYEEKDLEKGLIIDITGDQFDDYEEPVYVGYVDSFHRSFDFIQAHDYDGLNDGRLYCLYRMIEQFF